VARPVGNAGTGIVRRTEPERVSHLHIGQASRSRSEPKYSVKWNSRPYWGSEIAALRLAAETGGADISCDRLTIGEVRPIWAGLASGCDLDNIAHAWSNLRDPRRKAIRIQEEVMATLVGFGAFSTLLEEQISENIRRRILSGDQGMIVWWSIGAGVHVEPHSHPNEQIVWMLKGKMEFRLGTEQRVCDRGDVVVILGGVEHEAWFREDTEVIDFFAPPRADFLLGGKPSCMSERTNPA
jgi:quercetin dioxygenase-like cupin family protein